MRRRVLWLLSRILQVVLLNVVHRVLCRGRDNFLLIWLKVRLFIRLLWPLLLRVRNLVVVLLGCVRVVLRIMICLLMLKV